MERPHTTGRMPRSRETVPSVGNTHMSQARKGKRVIFSFNSCRFSTFEFTIFPPFHRIIWGSFFSFSVLFPWVHLFPRYMRHAFSLLTPVASRLRCMTGNGPRRVAALGGCLGLLLGGSLLAGCDSDSANFAVFWHVNVGDPNFASPSPGPLPSSPPAPADSLHTLLYFIAFSSKLRGTPILWESSWAACGGSFPC